jgi:hypothetical protein
MQIEVTLSFTLACRQADQSNHLLASEYLWFIPLGIKRSELEAANLNLSNAEIKNARCYACNKI